jgi:hypothetical protein
MPKNNAAQEKKVNAAMRFLQTTIGVKVPQAMIVAGFSKKDVANEIVRQMIRRRYQHAQSDINNVVVGDEPSLSDLTNDDVQSPLSAFWVNSPKAKVQADQVNCTRQATAAR